MAKDGRLNRPETKRDFVKRNYETMSNRAIAATLGISMTRLYQIARYELRLPPKPKPVYETYDWACKGCGKKEKMTNKRKLERVYCDECKPARGRAIGQKAYMLRHATRQTWEAISVEVGSASTESCREQAKRWAIRNNKPWPIAPLTMADVLRLAKSMTSQPPSPPA